MSRHRKVKALDYDQEYDDYYGEFDDDDEDFDEDQFESKYLSSGIDLNASPIINTNKINKQRQTIIAEKSSSNSPHITTTHPIVSNIVGEITSDSHIANRTNSDDNQFSNRLSKNSISGVISRLDRLALLESDESQWQLPLMEMDKMFLDKTYYRHYTDSYLSSLRSKLGHFLADNQMISNPMKHHLQQELDNYMKYSKMFELLTEYYQSLGGAFFSFATPSPDEEIVIGCRLGTKVKKQVPKPAVVKAEPKSARFEFQGPKASAKQQQASTSKNAATGTSLARSQTPGKPTDPSATSNSSEKFKQPTDLTIREDFTSDQLDTLSKNYKESLSIASTKKAKNVRSSFDTNSSKSNQTKTVPVKQQHQGVKSKQSVSAASTSSSTTAKRIAPSQQAGSSQPAKQLATLNEKRQSLKQNLKRTSEPTAQDRENFKIRALQTTKEYDEIMKSSRARLNLVVVGHVDAGKSTLVGHLLFKLGQISGKQMHRFEVDSQRSGKASFKFAWALDETAEERARGVTIDIALTQFETAHKDVVLLDAPGHVDFIPAVISGAAQADAALLIVDATRGEFETGFSAGGQTREHTFLVRSLGVRSLVVVVNKMDTVGWSWTRFSDIVEQLKPFLKQVGFSLKDDVQFVAASGLTGENLTESRSNKLLKQSSHPQLEGEDVLAFSSTPSLLEAIDKMRQPERMVDKPTRVCVTDVFKGMSSGVFLGARVVSGKVETKQKLLSMPTQEICEVKQVQVRDSQSSRAFAGDIVTLVAIGIDVNKYYRGCMLCDTLIPCHVTNRFQARIIMFQNANTILIKGTPIELHINGTYESGQVRKLISLLNKSTGELMQKKPRCLTQNSSAIVQLKLSRVVCCELYEDNKDLGRFMMRSYGKTIAAGLITKIKSAKVAKASGSKLKSK